MASHSADKLLEQYEFIGVDPDSAVLAKSLELCISYKISEEDLVESWVAFAISHLKSAPPTVDGLELLERKELAKNKASTHKGPSHNNQSQGGPGASRTLQQAAQKCAPPSLSESSAQTTVSQCLTEERSSSQIPNYSDRPNIGAVVSAHGTPVYSRCMSAASVKIFSGMLSLGSQEAHMHYGTVMPQQVLGEIIYTIASDISEHYSLSLTNVWDRMVTEDITLFGSIMPATGNRLGKLNVGLELPGAYFANGEIIPLNLAELPTYSLFPGQVAVVKGKFEKEDFKVKQLFTDATPPQMAQVCTDSVQVMIAFGPFTRMDNLLFEPLQDLLKVVIRERPHVLILGGPFLDEEHSTVTTIAQDYDSLFESLVESIITPLDGVETQVVLLPSHRDVHHFPVYPTLPFHLGDRFPRLLLAPDPCVLDVGDGVLVAVTTVDALFPLGRNELVHPPDAIDRMARLCKHLFQQRSFYPYRADERQELPIDYKLLESYGLMEKLPHILAFPSKFRYFIKDISGCTVVNPKELIRGGRVAGTYCRMQIVRNPHVEVTAEVINI